MVASIVVTILSAWVITEFAGYWLHRTLHSEKIQFLSRSHMIHHLVIYAPTKPMRLSREYLRSTYDRAHLLGIGLEWLLPIGIHLLGILGLFHLLGIGVLHQTLFIAAALAWGWFMFGYMHDNMHIKGFWMENSSWLARWFLNARKLHDIHHMEIEDSGREAMNFGICFFLFDRIFGTLSSKHKKFNHTGLEAAMKRYAYIFEEA